jgi:hypothetical protein
MEKEYFIQLFKSSWHCSQEEGFFCGFDGETHIVVKRRQDARLMSKEEARIASDKLHRWNCPISLEIKTDVLVLNL